jgi:hypothetical protein
LERIFDKFLKYHMEILLGDFNAKVGWEDIFKATIGNGSLHKISNYNGVTVVNFATSKNLTFKSLMGTKRTGQSLANSWVSTCSLWFVVSTEAEGSLLLETTVWQQLEQT